MFSRIPLAWKNLVHDKRRLLIAVSGIVFAVVLMFTQTGFRNGLFDSTVAIIRQMNGDIVIYSRAKFALVSYMRFDSKVLELARAVDGIESVEGVYAENPFATIRRVNILNPSERPDKGARARPIRVIGVNLKADVLKNVSPEQLAKLQEPNSALIDSRSKQAFGFKLNDVAVLKDQSAELSGRKIKIVGTFEMGTDFANDGNLLMSHENFAHFFPQRNFGGNPLELVDMGIVKLEPGANTEQVLERLRQLLPDTTYCKSMDRYERDEIRFWATSTPIGTIFMVGTIMGFVVGIIICYQVLVTDIADHMSEFATLKAMGYSNAYFVRLVLTESFFLSLFGFLPGMLLAVGLFQVVSTTTGLVMILTIPRILIVYGLTLLMCVVSGLIAVRKLVSADPASLF